MKKLLWVASMVPHYNRDLFTRLATRLPESGVEFHLLSGAAREGATGRIGIAGKVIANEHKLRCSEWSIGSYCIRKLHGVTDHVRSLRPDIVVSASQVGNLTTWDLMRTKRRLGYCLAAWQCGYEVHRGRLKSALLARYIRGFDFHFAYHTNAKAYALEYGAREDQIAVVHNTLNEARIQQLPRDEARSRVVRLHPQIGKRRIVLYVGAVLQEKRLEAVVSALAFMARDDLVFMVVGDGPHLPVLQARYRARNDVIFAGRVVEGVGAYFDAADVFILPGTGGLALNEAMAHALPIVCGHADGSADDLVVTGLNGIRLQSASADEIAQHLGAMLSDDVRRASMAKASRDRLLERFPFESFIDRICRAVAHLTDDRPEARW